MMFNLHMRILSKVRAFAASFICAFMASLLLAALVAQTKGSKCYNLQTSGACEGERISLVRRPDSVYDVKSLDMRLAHGRFLLDHIEAPIAARLFPLRCDVLSRKFWSGENIGPGDQNSRKIGPPGPLFPENLGPAME